MAGELEILTDAMSNLPVNVEQVIEDLGIQYFNEPMDKGQSGAIELKDGKYTIRVNSLEPRQRQRFTAAHELAHYLLHREMLVKQGRLARHADSLYDEHAQKNVAVPFNPHHKLKPISLLLKSSCQGRKSNGFMILPKTILKRWPNSWVFQSLRLSFGLRFWDYCPIACRPNQTFQTNRRQACSPNRVPFAGTLALWGSFQFSCAAE